MSQLVGNKAKGRISYRVFQDNKARQILWKTNTSYPLIRTRMCAYQRVRNICFSENLACFVYSKHLVWYSPFRLITDELMWQSFWNNYFEIRKEMMVFTDFVSGKHAFVIKLLTIHTCLIKIFGRLVKFMITIIFLLVPLSNITNAVLWYWVKPHFSQIKV